jgi:hypothetical protein
LLHRYRERRELTGPVHGKVKVLDIPEAAEDLVEMRVGDILGQLFHDDLD